MFKSLRQCITTAVATLALAFIPMVVAPAMAHAADITTCLSQGSGLTVTDGANCTAAAGQADATTRINSIITTVINIFSLVVGIVAVVMIVFGGFKYITSGGDSGNISGAKNTILYAIIGLVVVAFAQFIVQFVLNKVQP
ncbi:MAG TPA: pilin [Candidatus Saccharimonadales bacterium]|nr:pilin [Candidatus Saccharimonadales bacterium]